MGPDRGLRPGLVGAAEPEPVRQRRPLHVGEVPLVELGPEPGVAERRRVGLEPVRLPSLERELVGHPRHHLALKVRRDVVVPIDHVVNQLGLAGMDLISQIGARDLLYRPVASPHLVRQVGPPPGNQLAAGNPQTTPPGPGVGGMILTPDPVQLPERRVVIHQIGPDRGDALGQALHEQDVLGSNEIEVTHAGHCVRTPANRRTVFTVAQPGLSARPSGFTLALIPRRNCGPDSPHTRPGGEPCVP